MCLRMLGHADPVHQQSLILHNIHHIQQASTWDCGVTCVLMLLGPEQRQQALSDLPRICSEEGFGYSTWTIDLCFLLKRFGIDHRMHTINAGVNESHRTLKYYTSIIDKDRDRVSSRFASSSSQGIVVNQVKLTPQQLINHLPTGPALVLVNGKLLDCDRCRRNKLRATLRRWFGAPFSGHYILIVGFDPQRQRFLYLDPAHPPCPGPSHLQTLETRKDQPEVPKDASKISSSFHDTDKEVPGLLLKEPLGSMKKVKELMMAQGVGRYGGQIPCMMGVRRLLAAAAAPGTDNDVILIDKSYR